MNTEEPTGPLQVGSRRVFHERRALVCRALRFCLPEERSIDLPMGLGFPANQASHLAGISDPTTPWQKEAAEAVEADVESVVLFALDQYCLIGYSSPSPIPAARSFMLP